METNHQTYDISDVTNVVTAIRNAKMQLMYNTGVPEKDIIIMMPPRYEIILAKYITYLRGKNFTPVKLDGIEPDYMCLDGHVVCCTSPTNHAYVFYNQYDMVPSDSRSKYRITIELPNQ